MSVLELESSLLCGSAGGLIPGVLWVDKGESLELVLVQVLNHFLVRRGQHRRVACEKTVKVLRIPSTLLRRVGRDEIQGWGEGRSGDGQKWMECRGWDKGRKTKRGGVVG